MLLCDIPHFGSTIRHNFFLQTQLSNITRIVQRSSASLFDSDLKSLNITRLAIQVVTSDGCWNISVFCCLQHTARCRHITAHCTLQTHYSTLHTADTLQHTAHYRHIAQFVLFSFAVCSNTKPSTVSIDHYVYCSIN